MRWQPIESAPKDGTAVLCWVQPKTGDGHVDILRWSDTHTGDSAHFIWSPVDCEVWPPDDPVTHWMPLPEAP